MYWLSPWKESWQHLCPKSLGLGLCLWPVLVAGHWARKLSVNNIHVCSMELTRMFTVCHNQCWTFHPERNKDLCYCSRGEVAWNYTENMLAPIECDYWSEYMEHRCLLYVVDTCSLWHGVISHCCCAKRLGTLSLAACWLMTCFQGVEKFL